MTLEKGTWAWACELIHDRKAVKRPCKGYEDLFRKATTAVFGFVHFEYSGKVPMHPFFGDDHNRLHLDDIEATDWEVVAE